MESTQIYSVKEREGSGLAEINHPRPCQHPPHTHTPPAGEEERSQSKYREGPGDVGHRPGGASSSKAKGNFAARVTGAPHTEAS